MPSDFPQRPKLMRGAIVVYPTQTPGARPSHVISFQFNPDQMKRSLAHRAPPTPSGSANTGQAKEDVLRVAGPPVETISITVDLHASEQLEDPDSNAVAARVGLHGVLATLEMLMYPPTLSAQKMFEQAQRGVVSVQPADLPMTLFVWGQSRVVPVKITSFSVSEDAYDTRLNPISAKVELAMQVLTYMEFPDASVGRDAFISYQQQKERLMNAYKMNKP